MPPRKQPSRRERYVSDREKQRVRSLVAVFNKTNRILTGDRAITVFMPQGNSADDIRRNAGVPVGTPGWSTYPYIWINGDEFRNLKSSRTVVQLLGLNYHELAHLMFTPKIRERTVKMRQMSRAMNILEDQRIESFFTATYPPAGKYFTEMVVRFLVENERSWSSAFMLTYGRGFLPLEIREEFEAKFVAPQHVKRIKELINEYKTFRSVHFRTQGHKVEKVIEEFDSILNSLAMPPESTGCDSQHQEGGSASEKQEQSAAEKDQERREREEETGEDQSEFWEDEEDDGDEPDAPAEDSADDEGEGDDDDEDGEEGSGPGDEEDGEEEDGGDDSSDSSDGDELEGDSQDDKGAEDAEPGDGSASGDGESSELEDDSEEEEEGEDEGGEGQGGSGIFEDDSELKEYLQDVIDAVDDDENVQSEVDNLKAAMNDMGNIDVIDFGGVNFKPMAPDPVAVQSASKVGLEFRRLYAEVEPGWNYGSNVGRLNIGRAIADPENYEEMFDEWDEGRENEVGLEVVISCDLSASMMGRAIRQSSEALWIIKRALDEVEAKTTVLGFHESTVGLFSRDEKVKRNEWPLWTDLGGDTQPAQSMHLARRILTQSPMPNKLFVFITDGVLGNTNAETGKSEPLHELVDTIPGTKMYVGIGDYASNQNVQSRFHVVKTLQDPNGLVELTKHTVEAMLRGRRR